MKNILCFIAIIFCSITVKAQIFSSCLVPQTLVTNYDRDVKHLALKSIYTNITSPYRDSIIVPQIIQEPIWEGLAAIYNLTTIPERDSAIDNYCIHQQPSNYSFYSIYVGVDTSNSWTHQWQNLITTTGITTLDNLLSTYGFTVTNFSTFGGNYATLTTTQNINVRPVCDSIETFLGVLYSEPNTYIGDGNSITYIESGNDRIYYFTLGLGDCPSGCTEFHSFRFKVYPDCSVSYLGTFSTATYLPNPINCNITANINNEKYKSNFKIFPNPVKDFLYVESNYLVNTNYSIVNLYGQVVLTGNLKNDKIFLKDLTTGIYLIKFQDRLNNIFENYKIIKE